MKIGDLIWYNSAGSNRTAIVLDFVRNNWLDYFKETEMVKIFWVGGTGAKPAMYGDRGDRIYDGNAYTCFVPSKTKTGLNMFKVVSGA